MFIQIITGFAWALLLTVIIEEVLGLPLAHFLFKKSKAGEMFLYILLCNLITNPLVNLLVLFLGLGSISVATLFLEALVVLAEGILIKLFTDCKLARALLFAMILNSVSYGIGLLL